MYDPTIKLYETTMRITHELNKETDTMIFKAVKDVGVNVDKQELLRALQYDRDQYEKGREDTITVCAEAISKIPDLCRICPTKCTWGTSEMCVDVWKKYLKERGINEV